VAESTTLLTWQGIKPLEGSNPSVSALKEVPQERHLRSRLNAAANFIAMSNNSIIVAVIVVIILAVGGYFVFAQKVEAPVTAGAPEQPAASATTTVPAQIATIVSYTDSGFSPKSLTVAEGTTVNFVNNSSGQMWVAVGNHPTHTTYDGTNEQTHCSSSTNTNGSFDECKPVAPGTVYSFTFAKAGTFSFHNHVHASDLGTITVTK
jgi:plastocyanin